MPSMRGARGGTPTRRRPITGPCTFCPRPATRRSTVRDARTGDVMKPQVCLRHYRLHHRTGRFWNVQRWLSPKDLAEARRRRAKGEAIIDLAREYGIYYQTMKRYLSTTKPRETFAMRMK